MAERREDVFKGGPLPRLMPSGSAGQSEPSSSLSARPSGELSPAQVDEALLHRQKGWSARKIAEELGGVSEDDVNAAIEQATSTVEVKFLARVMMVRVLRSASKTSDVRVLQHLRYLVDLEVDDVDRILEFAQSLAPEQLAELISAAADPGPAETAAVDSP